MRLEQYPIETNGCAMQTTAGGYFSKLENK